MNYGDFIDIAGVTSTFMVLEKTSPNVVTLSNNADVTVSGTAVSYHTPLLESFGIIGDTISGGIQTLSFADPLAVDMDDGNVFTLTTTGNCTINASNGMAWSAGNLHYY